jgi:protein SCO1/2
MKKRSNIFGLILLAMVVIGAIVYTLSSQNRFNGIVYDPPQAMPDFTLDSAHGQVSLSDFRGKVIILFFGYTYCPDICPLALSYLKQSVGDLGNQAEDVQVIFISVDWKRDTPEGLAKYTANFNPDFLGLTGTEDQINQVTQDFGIYYLMNSPNSSGYYSVDHTASIMVLDQQGSHVLTWPNETQPEQMTSDLEKLFKE